MVRKVLHEKEQILLSLSSALEDLVCKNANSIVSVSADSRLGSGIVWDDDGTLITCAHVVGSRKEIDIIGSRKETGKVIGVDKRRDIAVIKSSLKKQGIKKREDKVQTGQLVFALANPLGEGVASTLGVVAGMLNIAGMDIITTDAKVNPGYSGGALVDAEGRMVGMNFAYMQSRGLAIPYRTVKRVVESIITEGSPKEAYIGISFIPVSIPERTFPEAGARKGLLLVSVDDSSPAMNAGLMIGDIVILDDEANKLLNYDIKNNRISFRIIRGGDILQKDLEPEWR